VIIAAVTSKAWGVQRRVSGRRLALLCLVGVLVAAATSVTLAVRAGSAAAAYCQRNEVDAAQRARAVAGSGQAVTVIGDSWSVGLHLEDGRGSWPSRLPGRVRVAGFSGSGFAHHASSCGAKAFVTRAGAAAGADLVVVQGGLNDYDQPTADIRDGFRSLVRELGDKRVVVVGPASAPRRASAVARVNDELARLAAAHDIGYIDTSGWRLPYLKDRLHLTPTGHRLFGDRVAHELADLPESVERPTGAGEQ